MAVVLEYLKMKVIEWRFTNVNFVLNITLLLHFTTKVRGIWCVLLVITTTFADDSSHEIVSGHTLQQEVQSLVAWDRKNKCNTMSSISPLLALYANTNIASLYL